MANDKRDTMQKEIQIIVSKLCPPDTYETGYANLTGLLIPEFNNYQYGISLVRKLDDEIIDEVKNGPTIDYHDLYNSINDELNEKVNIIVESLKEISVNALPIKATLHDAEIDKESRETLRSKLSHKMCATQSGLGWIGKTDLFISKRFGSRVRLASVLTDIPFSPEQPPVMESRCGSCNICVESCPADAANGRLWKAGIDRGEFYDAFKCRAHCRTISKKNLDKEISICGICVAVCPIGQKNKV